MESPAKDSVWVQISYTLNLGNYESCKVEIGTTRIIQEGESTSIIRKKLFDQINEELKSKSNQIREDYENELRERHKD